MSADARTEGASSGSTPERQPLPTAPSIRDGACLIHGRHLTYAEQRAGACAWCEPEKLGMRKGRKR